jgi:16S rRNA C967 or C1407 C5-methylase (RsmB/RsmF family)
MTFRFQIDQSDNLSIMSKYPPSFQDFCTKYHIDLKLYELGSSIPRTVRLKSTDNIDQYASLLEKELLVKVKQYDWLPSEFFYFDQHVKITNCSLYQKRLLYGIDASSALAVYALNPKENDKILDLCCSPGAKLTYLSDYLKYTVKATNYYITGVDISKSRLFICRSMIEKYQCENIRLILADGVTYKISPNEMPFNNRKLVKNVLKKDNPLDKYPQILVFQKGNFTKDHIEMCKKQEKTDLDSSIELYDKILVDAECSTDGSVKHLSKMDSEEWKKFEKIYSNESRLDEIVALQKQLIHNGFKLLKTGGILIYSTCSFLKSQNEDVVEWLCSVEKSAIVIPSHLPKNTPCKEGSLKNTIRFDPSMGTSGFFMVTIQKI